MTNIAFMSGAAIISSVAQLNATQTDITLIALARRFEPQFAEYLRLTRSLAPLQAAIKSDDWDLQRWQISGAEAIESQLEDLLEKSAPVVEEIMRADAESIIGLAVKARAAAMSQLNLWDKPFDELGWDQMHSRRLIEATLAAAGFPPPTEMFAVPELTLAA